VSDLGIGLSTPGKWVRAVSEEAKVPAQDAELLRENERLRKENRILRDLRRNRRQFGGLLKKSFQADAGFGRAARTSMIKKRNSIPQLEWT
jgi:hypothetical protein